MDEIQKAIQKAAAAIAAAANEVAAVEAWVKASTLNDPVRLGAQQHISEVALTLSEADGGLIELRELLEEPLPAPAGVN